MGQFFVVNDDKWVPDQNDWKKTYNRVSFHFHDCGGKGIHMFFLLGGPGPEKWESATFKRSSPKQFVMSKNEQTINTPRWATHKKPFYIPLY